jgi:hypothetical protein
LCNASVVLIRQSSQRFNGLSLLMLKASSQTEEGRVGNVIMLTILECIE